METIELDRDIKVMCVTATSFPEGIVDAHQELHKLVPFSSSRRYFGISRPENNEGIVYRAAAEELQDGETEELGCYSVTLRKGQYIGMRIHNFRNDMPGIGRAFGELLKQPGLDPQGYCVEWYANDEESVICMIRLEG